MIPVKTIGVRSKSLELLYWLIGITVLLNFSGLFVTLMDVDATRYAAIAKTIVIRNNWLELFCDGKDWLDKPHFPFWVTAAFFKLFGVNTWAYKLPGVLFMLMGAWYTFKLTSRLYSKEIALFAVVILLTAQHIVLSNNDVRAEPFLTGLIIASIYHFYRTYNRTQFLHLALGAFFAGCAIMTKGIFALVPIGGAIVAELIVKRDWKNLLHWRWLLACVLIFIFIMPELYALYYQFDLHPEKVVFEKTHVSGLHFFFWDSQFGRFMNTGPIKGEGDPLFFFHTLLWAFLPWSVLLYCAVFVRLRNYFRAPFNNQEWFCMGGALLTFALFSASKFQLPHYLNIVFPLFAIITSSYLVSIRHPRTLKVMVIIQYVIIGLFLLAPWIIQLVFKPSTLPAAAVAVMVILLLLILSRLFQFGVKQNLVIKSALACCYLNIYLNICFYPSLLQYQSGSEAAFWLNSHNSQHLPVAATKFTYSLEFYLKEPLVYTDSTGSAPYSAYLLYVPESDVPYLQVPGKTFKVIQQLNNYPITRMDLVFFNNNSRASTLKKYDIILVK